MLKRTQLNKKKDGIINNTIFPELKTTILDIILQWIIKPPDLQLNFYSS
jgi:hypothetical protein